MVNQWISAVVDFGEYVVSMSSCIEQFIFHTVDGPSSLMSIDVRFPLWIFRQTQEVAAAATLVVKWPCCVSFNNNKFTVTVTFKYRVIYLTAMILFTLH